MNMMHPFDFSVRVSEALYATPEMPHCHVHSVQWTLQEWRIVPFVHGTSPDIKEFVVASRYDPISRISRGFEQLLKKVHARGWGMAMVYSVKYLYSFIFQLSMVISGIAGCDILRRLDKLSRHLVQVGNELRIFAEYVLRP